MIEAILYKKLEQNRVQCQVCNHRCIIAEGRRGICQVRENQAGKLYSLVYGRAITEQVDPIEKKPLYHFLSGTETLSWATLGCNFKCLNCQNADISQVHPGENIVIAGQELPPEKIIQDALANNCPSISYTYTEPTVFLEYALATMKLASQEKLKNIWVTNGYFTEETFDLIKPYLDAANVDLKFFDEKMYRQVCQGQLHPVLDNLVRLKKNNIHLEVTTLIIPGLTDTNDQLEFMARFIYEELGEDTPWHLSRFHPCYQALDWPITPLETIEEAVAIGQDHGLKHVYAGNI
ncbi:MAG: AmmeMemoRadiSam system radical SAM enzyme [bacterium]